MKAPGKIISTFIEVIGIKKAVRDSGCLRGRGEKMKEGTTCMWGTP